MSYLYKNNKFSMNKKAYASKVAGRAQKDQFEFGADRAGDAGLVQVKPNSVISLDQNLSEAENAEYFITDTADLDTKSR